jgi:hypothetical protein
MGDWVGNSEADAEGYNAAWDQVGNIAIKPSISNGSDVHDTTFEAEILF